MVATFKLLQIPNNLCKTEQPWERSHYKQWNIVTSKLFRSNHPLSFLTTTK